MIILGVAPPLPSVFLFYQGSERGHRDGCGTGVGEDQRASGDGHLTRPSHGMLCSLCYAASNARVYVVLILDVTSQNTMRLMHT